MSFVLPSLRAPSQSSKIQPKLAGQPSIQFRGLVEELKKEADEKLKQEEIQYLRGTAFDAGGKNLTGLQFLEVLFDVADTKPFYNQRISKEDLEGPLGKGKEPQITENLDKLKKYGLIRMGFESKASLNKYAMLTRKGRKAVYAAHQPKKSSRLPKLLLGLTLLGTGTVGGYVSHDAAKPTVQKLVQSLYPENSAHLQGPLNTGETFEKSGTQPLFPQPLLEPPVAPSPIFQDVQQLKQRQATLASEVDRIKKLLDTDPNGRQYAENQVRSVLDGMNVPPSYRILYLETASQPNYANGVDGYRVCIKTSRSSDLDSIITKLVRAIPGGKATTVMEKGYSETTPAFQLNNHLFLLKRE
ncbi:MAG: hypothetical protein K2X66_04470 [Cyanobacteria bacterium]|nr:hypothetical protein [Cyanobacteriota bacterium]